MEILAEKLQITIMDKFSYSKCDMDFDLEKSLEEHSGNCEIAMLQPGEEHFDHTYSKGFPTATSVGLTEVKTEVKKEVKTERFEDFEVHEQAGIDYITSKNFDDPFIKSETSRMKTEFKAEVKEEAFEEFDTHEQIGMDFITSQHFDTLSNKSDISSISKQMKTEKTKIKEETIEVFEDFEEHTPKHESLPEQDQSEVVEEDEANNDHEFPNQGAQFVDVEDPAELIDQSDYSLDGNQSGEAMVYEGDPENPGVS